MTTLRIFFLFLLVASLSACSTTMTGARIGASPSGNLKGIPVNMTKPQFEVAYVPGATPKDEANTTITVKYVADYERRYVLNIDPNWLTSSGIGFTLGAEGQLVSMNSANSSNATAIVQTVGKIAKAVVSSGALDEASNYDSLATAIKAEKRIANNVSPPDSCLSGRTFKGSLVPRMDLPIEAVGAKNDVYRRITAAKNSPELQQQFRHMSLMEFRILKAVRCSLEEAYAKRYDTLLDEQSKALETVPSAVTAKAGDLAAAAVNSGKASIERVSALARLQHLLAQSENIKGKEYGIKTADLAGFSPDGALELVQSLVDMTLPDWQRRRVLSSQSQIEQLKREVVLERCDSPSTDAKLRSSTSLQCVHALGGLANAQEEMAAAVGRLTEYRLAAKLDAQVAAQAIHKGGVDPKNYQRLRTAADQAKADIANSRAAILKTPDPTVPASLTRKEVLMLKAPPGSLPEVGWVLDKTVTSLTDAEVLPDFVIVISKEKAQ
jgi:hypothetical protein